MEPSCVAKPRKATAGPGGVVSDRAEPRKRLRILAEEPASALAMEPSCVAKPRKRPQARMWDQP
ncbi:hypothetical protein JCM33774_44830 [Actinophytocola sp. KF-1]